jgi:GNAT superfamily N-acetyltransferase
LTRLEELAEDIEVLLPVPQHVVREDFPDCVLMHTPDSPPGRAAFAFRLRFEQESVDGRAAAIRRWFGKQGQAEFIWWIGTSATPSDLESRLLSLGASPDGDDPVITSMMTTDPPPTVPGIEVRLVERFEDFVLAREIFWETAGFTDEQAVEARAALPKRWEERRRLGAHVLYLACVDGEPVAAGDCVVLPFGVFLSGGSTRPGYRGRGAYRALVRARWDEAVRRGTPALIVGAGRMSRPILDRIGFRPVAEQHLLVDRSGLDVST